MPNADARRSTVETFVPSNTPKTLSMKQRITQYERELWLSRPLCRRYPVTSLCSSVASILSGASTFNSPIVWSLGFLHGGDWEVLGAWPQAATSQGAWTAAVGDMNERGVERYEVVLSHADAVVPEWLPQLFAPAAVFPALKAPRAGESRLAARLVLEDDSSHATKWLGNASSPVAMSIDPTDSAPTSRARRQPPAACSGSPHAIVSLAGLITVEVQRRLAGSLKRHEAFHSPSAALDFTADALRWQQHRMHRSSATSTIERWIRPGSPGPAAGISRSL